MGSLKALQEWCRLQCEDYNDVEIKNMSASFRDGLAFCAIIHKHRPDLIDFDSLSKENVYENNHLAFQLAEKELGIPALLDAEDMESMKVPDRLSIITYVSQYYNYFTNKSHANPPCLKRPGGTSHIEPSIKRPPTPLEERTTQAELNADSQLKRSTLSSTCAACGKHVHLVQRFLVDGKLYHRNCFRCRECCSTLLPGSYKLVGDTGSLVCTQHFARMSSTSQNGRPDLSKQLAPTASITSPQPTPSGQGLEKALPTQADVTEPVAPSADSPKANPPENEREQTDKGGEELRKEAVNGSKEEAEPRSSSPPNPFDESEEEEEEEAELKKEEQPKPKQAADVSNGVPLPTPLKIVEDSRPVPAPRKVLDPAPPARPVPRPRPSRTSQSSEGIEDGDRRPSPPVPRGRSHSPAGQAGDTPKPKDPPWLALVKQETKKKMPPPPPPPPASAHTVIVTPPQATSEKEVAPRAATPLNPFDDEDEKEAEASAPPSVAAGHPWYGITQAPDSSGTDTPPRKGSPTPSGDSGSGRSKKRPAPRAPKSSPSALSTESLSSSSSERAVVAPAAAAAPRRPSSSEQEHGFTKSVSEPSINTPNPCSSSSSSSSSSIPSAELQSRLSQTPSQPPSHSNTCSAPATPETNRSAGSRALRPPPPRPPGAPSPLIESPSPQPPSTPSKRICKENPFNRKASPPVTSPQSRPPKGPRPARPPAPGHGFPLIKRKVQSDQFIPVEDIHVEMGALERQLDELEHRGVDLEQRLRDCTNEEEEEKMLVDWFTLIHEKHLLVRREAELVYTVKQQHLEERQADVEYELRCLLNKPEKEWTEDDRNREKELMAELVTIIEQRNQIINSMDQDRQREEEEDKLVAAMLKKKEFHSDSEHKKKSAKFKPMKVLKRLSTKSDVSPRKEKS